MGNSSEEVFRRLEGAIAKWDATLREVREAAPSPAEPPAEWVEALEKQLAQVLQTTADMQSALQTLTSEMAGLQHVPEQLETLGRLLADREGTFHPLEPDAEHDERVTALVRQLAERTEERNTAQAELDELRARLDGEAASRAAYADEEAGAPTVEDVEPIALDVRDELGGKLRIGEILLRAGIVTAAQLETALAAQNDEGTRRHLGEVLVEQGFTGEDVVARVVASQLGIAFSRLTPGMIDEAATELISARMARHHSCVPIRATDEELHLAMCNPLDVVAMDDIAMAAERRVVPVMSTTSDVAAALERIYGQGA